MISRQHPLLKLFWAVGVVAIVFYSATEFDPASIAAGMWDKLGHFLAYFVVATIGFFASTVRRHRMQLALGMILLGLLLEVIQFYTPGRMFEWADWLADGIGVAIGFGVYWMVTAMRRLGN